MFNLNKEYSKIFVGGFPTEQKVQGEITSTDMEGQIEGLMIGGKSVGLWNLKKYERIEAASSRLGVSFKEKNIILSIHAKKMNISLSF